MPNAKNATVHEKFVLIGGTGSGKTTQFLTLPGKKYAYIFEPAALSTLRGYDVDYDIFLPGAEEADIGAHTVLKDHKQTFDQPTVEPKVYLNWCEDINAKWEADFFSSYDAILIDSLTLLGKHCLNRTQWLQRKAKRDDERTDYRIAGERLGNVALQLATLPCTILMTVHHEYRKNDTTSRLENRLTMPGSARLIIPRTVSNIWVCSCESTKDKPDRYFVQTRPSRENNSIRTSMRFSELKMYHDVTIDDLTTPEKYGIGGLLNAG